MPAKVARLLTRAAASVDKAAAAGPTTPAGRRAARKAARFVKKFQRKLASKAMRDVADETRSSLGRDAAALLADLPALS